MKFKRSIVCGILAVTLLCGCNGQNSSESSEISENESSVSEDDYSGIKVTSEKPKEIDGFLGNTVDVEPKAGDLIATFDIKNYGIIKAVLFPEAAPIGVENFQKLCDEGFYKGLNIHRVMNNFMFQGGSANGNGTGGEALVNGGGFGIETAQNARHFYGALCYANAGGINTTQFYIVNNKEPQEATDEILANFSAIVEEGLVRARAEKDNNGDEAAVSYYVQTAQEYQTMIDWASNYTDEIKARYKEKGGYFSLDGMYTVFGQVYEGFDVIDAISAVEVTDNGMGQKTKPVQDIIINDITVSTFEG